MNSYNMMINDKDDLINELINNNGFIILPNCILIINGLSIDNLFYSIYMDGVEFIRDDEDNYDMPSNYSEEEFLIEFLDRNRSIIASIPLDEIDEIKING